MLVEFAKLLKHEVLGELNQVNVHYLSSNLPNDAENHYYGLQNVVATLKGIAIFDRLDKEIKSHQDLTIECWKKRELENYFAFPQVLERFSEEIDTDTPLFQSQHVEKMKSCIEELIPPIALKDRKNAWWNDHKMSDDFLSPLFENYYKEIGSPKNLMYKGKYYELIRFLDVEDVDQEIKEKLDMIHGVIASAKVDGGSVKD